MSCHCINATQLPNSRLFQPQIPLLIMNYRHLPQNAVDLTLNHNKTWPLNNRLNKSSFLFLNSSHGSNIFFPPCHFRVNLGSIFYSIFPSNQFQLFSRMPSIYLIFILIEDIMMTMIFIELNIILIQQWVSWIDQDIKNTFVMTTWKRIISFLDYFVKDLWYYHK